MKTNRPPRCPNSKRLNSQKCVSPPVPIKSSPHICADLQKNPPMRWKTKMAAKQIDKLSQYRTTKDSEEHAETAQQSREFKPVRRIKRLRRATARKEYQDRQRDQVDRLQLAQEQNIFLRLVRSQSLQRLGKAQRQLKMGQIRFRSQEAQLIKTIRDLQKRIEFTKEEAYHSSKAWTSSLPRSRASSFRKM